MATLLHPIETKKGISKGKLIFSLIIFLGLILLLDGYRIRQEKRSMSFIDEPQKGATVNGYGSTPVNIKVNGLGIDIEVKEAKRKNGWWELSNEYALHKSTTAFPGQKGNTVIYAHNDRNLFGPLINKARTGQKIEILIKDGDIYTYEITKIQVVDQSESNVIDQTPEEVLTLYTCTGLFDMKRLIVKAKPVAKYSAI